MLIVSKVLPSNACFKEMIHACNCSLNRLSLSFIDLYLFHWRSSVPLQETLDAFKALQSSRKIRYFGVSNFKASSLHESPKLTGSSALAANQILHNLNHRRVEWDVIQLCRDNNIPIIAYSPLEQG